MIFAPGSFARTTSARSAVAKSPGTNSPVSSTKKQRSASPSNATPRSAPSSSVFATMNSRFSGSSGFGSWFGKLPSSSKKQLHRLDRQPFEHRRQHRARHPVRRVDHDLQRPDLGRRPRTTARGRRTRARCRRVSTVPRVARPVRDCPSKRAVAHVEQARIAADRHGARAHDLHPGVLLRVVRGGDHDPAVEAERADREVDHLRPDEPDVDHVGARLGRALDQRRRHRRRGEPRVAPDGDPLRGELLDVGAPDRAARRPRRSPTGRSRARRTP